LLYIIAEFALIFLPWNDDLSPRLVAQAPSGSNLLASQPDRSMTIAARVVEAMWKMVIARTKDEKYRKDLEESLREALRK
jgi:hypothetical protein